MPSANGTYASLTGARHVTRRVVAMRNGDCCGGAHGGQAVIRGLLVLLALLAAGVATAQDEGPAFLVANINRGLDHSAGSWPRSFTAAGDYVYFVADDGTHGDQLWRTDHTPSGTVRVGDPIPPGGPYADYRPDGLTALDDTLYFTAAGALWRVRGTSAPELVESDAAWILARLGSEILFARDEQIWITDGTPAAARWVAPAFSGDGFVSDRRLFALSCDYDDSGCSLWSSDGTPAGTGIVRQLGAGPLHFLNHLDLPLEHAAIGDIVYFLGETADAGVELWRSDGSADGTWMVRDINPGPASAFPIHYDNSGDPLAYLAAVGDQVFFVASNGTTGFELWRSDGTPAGTQPVADTVAGSEGLFDCVHTDQGCDAYTRPAVLDGMYYIAVRQPGDDGTWQLWRSDGTAAGTRVLESGIDPHIVAGNGQLYFVRRDDEERPQLWRRGAMDDASGPVTAIPGWVWNLTALPGGIAFGLARSDIGWWSGEPWWSDGTAAGTYLLRDIRGDDASSSPRELLAFGDALLFSADDGVHGRELWRSDASAAGTALVADIAAGAAGSDPQRPVRVGDLAIFSADDGVHGRELWRSDGTAEGTALVADIRSGAASADPSLLTAAGAFVFFFADDGEHGRELWRSDGTAAGTVLIGDLTPGAEDSEPESYTAYRATVGDGFIFVTRDSTALWRSNGTPGDARVLIDFGAPSWIGGLVADGDAIWASTSGPDGPAIWRSDDTGAGTLRIPVEVEISSLVASGGGIYGRSYGNEDGVWRLDGPTGPMRVATPPSSWYSMLDAGGVLLGGGTEGLWRLGDDELDYSPSVERLFAFGRRVLLLPWQSYYDTLELWTSDGTDGGTFELQSLPGIDTSRYSSTELPAEAVAAGGHVFFAAETGDIGEELWALPLDALPELCTENCPGLATPTPTTTATELPQSTPTRAPTRASTAAGSGCAIDPSPRPSGVAWPTFVLLLILGVRRRRISAGKAQRAQSR